MPKEKKYDHTELLEYVRSRITQWEDETAFVTDKVAFNMRNLIRQLRKNYWGVFDAPIDPTTGRKKTWVPLTESIVEAVVKNIDLDTKDINIRAKRPDSVGISSLVRTIVKNKLDKLNFGEMLDITERSLAIDGTVVWKTFEGFDEKSKQKSVKVNRVDLLNCYIDPTAESIQKTEVFIERAVMDKQELMSYDAWNNKQLVKEFDNVHKTERDLNYTTTSTGQSVEVFEAWGLLPIGKDGEMVEGHAVIANIMNDPVVMLVEKNEKGLKPYEECWYRRMPGRWYGRGIAEMVMMLQLWVNTIVNIRINRARVSQLGIFKVKKGAGVTPQMLSRLASNGAITVNSMDDIEQFVMQEASQASYNDEQVVQSWSERVTHAFEVVTGEALPSSTPATNAIIQNQNAQSSFTMIKEGLGMFLQRWLEDHALPIIAKTIKKGDIVRMTGDNYELQKMDERIANNLLFKKLEQLQAEGKFFDEQQVQQEKNRILDKLKKSGEDRFIKLLREVDFSEFDVEVYVTNEEVDKNVLVQNLFTALQLAPEHKDAVMEQIFDLMGLDVNQLKGKEQIQVQPQQQLQAVTPQVPNQNPQEIIQAANQPVNG